eukprot:3244424-Amphidinium_carterae.1
MRQACSLALLSHVATALFHVPLQIQRVAPEESSLVQKTAANPWTNKNGNTHATGYSPSVALRNLEDGPAWGFEADPEGLGIVPHLHQIWATPIIDADQNIIVQAGDGEIHKFTRDGVELWQTQTFIMGANIPALMDNVLYTVAADGIFRAFNASTGAAVWEKKIGDDGAFNDARS